MMDSRLLQGMLIASCLCVLFAIAITWADIGRYRQMSRVAPPRAEPTQVGAAAVETAPAEAEPASAEGAAPAAEPEPAEAAPPAAAAEEPVAGRGRPPAGRPGGAQ